MPRLQEIESKLDTLKTQEHIASSQVNPTPEPRRLSLPGKFTSLPDLTLSPCPNMKLFDEKARLSRSPQKLQDKDITEKVLHDENLDDSELSSNCSTPTLMEIKNIRKVHILESITLNCALKYFRRQAMKVIAQFSKILIVKVSLMRF